MSVITPGERRELRSVVKQQFHVLRAEVEQRKAELVAEAEAQLVERYRGEDKMLNDLNWRVSQAVDQVNKDIEDLLSAAGFDEADDPRGGGWRRRWRLSPPTFSRTNEARAQLRSALLAGITAQVKDALLAIDRQEADLLRQLAITAIESDAAKEFLLKIPTVAELVPSRRLREIEAAFDQGKTP